MSLPAYAEELKRLNDARPFDDQAYADVAAHVELHLDRILCDAAIAEAARELVALNELHKDATKPYRKIAALIAKETP